MTATPPTTACARCGEPIMAGAHFCPKCGADISGAQGHLTTMQMPMGTSAANAAQTEMLDLLRQATIGEYDIMGELGRGGMATVYLAHDMALDRKVAIKIMNPQMLVGEGMVDRFKREARTAASLSHPHIIPIHGVKETNRILYFVMKFVQGRGLDAIIREKGPLPIGMVEAILSQVGGALGYAHRRGIIHRDVKPANIMIDDEGWAVVTDFGIAKVSEARGLTMTGATVGTPYYMSPEQCSAKAITGASDQYSLGIVAYEMLSGKPPFQGESIMEIMKAHFFDAPPPIASIRPDCPPALANVISRMLAKEPGQRWPSLEEAVAAIGAKALSHDDPIHTQMVELAKSVLELKPIPKFTTPISLPMGKRPPPSAAVVSAETVKVATPPPKGRPAPASRGRGWMVAIPVVLVAGIGAYVALGRGAPAPVSKPSPVVPTPTITGNADSGKAPAQQTPANGTVPPATTPSAPPATQKPVTQRPNRPGPGRERRAAQHPVTTPVETAGGTGTIRLGTRGSAAVLYVDNVPQGTIAGLQLWSVKGGLVHLSIRAEGCTSWDSTVTVTPGVETRIGYRSPTCQ